MGKNRVLIIGGNGFIGTNLCTYLNRQGYAVTSFDIVRPERKAEKVHYIEGDFFSDGDLSKAIEGQDVVIHALSTINPGNSNREFMRGYERDFIQSVKLFSLLAETHQKAIFISSGGTVYGEQIKQPIPETATTHPLNHYGSVKLCIENAIRAINAQCGSRFLIARPSNPYGPGQDYNKGVGFIDAVVKKTFAGEEIEIWGDGGVVRDYIYIDDLCKMISALIDYKGEYDVFNLSSGEGVSQNQIVEILKKINLSPKVVYKEARQVDLKKVVLSHSRMEEAFGVKITELQVGIERLIASLTGGSATS